MATFAMLVVLAHLLFAQLTFMLAVVFTMVGKVSRWRLWWLAAPAAAGLAWTLAIGPRAAAAGFAAGPARLLGYLSAPGGHPLSRLLHPLGMFAGAGSWLPLQFPIALIVASAEAALAGWLAWVHTDEWAVRPPRPGAVAAVRCAVAGRAIRAGAVVTRDGCAMGVAPGSGARVVLSWPEAAGGVLVTGASAQVVAMTSLQLVHAALRRRKPVIAVDLSAAAAAGDVAVAEDVALTGAAGTARAPAVAGALAAACSATGTPLRVFGPAEGCYEPFRQAGPARRVSLTLALLGADIPGGGRSSGYGGDGGNRSAQGSDGRSASGLRTYLLTAFELMDAVPADPRTRVLDDLLHLLNPTALEVRFSLVPATDPRLDQLAELVHGSVRKAQADQEPILSAARQLAAIRRSPAGRWLCPAAGGPGRPGGIDLVRVVRQRSAALFDLDSPDMARLVCADIVAIGEDLRRLGVDGDGLIWLHGHGDWPPGSLARLVASGATAGLPVLVTTTSPAAAADLAGLLNAVLIHRLNDPDAAVSLAARTGTRLMPAGSHAARQPALAGLAPPAPPAPPSVPAAEQAARPSVALASGAEFVPRPAVPPRALLTLGPAQFVLAVRSPTCRLVELGQAVPARLPRGAGP
jgi:hypothetical protein